MIDFRVSYHAFTVHRKERQMFQFSQINTSNFSQISVFFAHNAEYSRYTYNHYMLLRITNELFIFKQRKIDYSRLHYLGHTHIVDRHTQGYTTLHPVLLNWLLSNFVHFTGRARWAVFTSTWRADILTTNTIHFRRREQENP